MRARPMLLTCILPMVSNFFIAGHVPKVQKVLMYPQQPPLFFIPLVLRVVSHAVLVGLDLRAEEAGQGQGEEVVEAEQRQQLSLHRLSMDQLDLIVVALPTQAVCCHHRVSWKVAPLPLLSLRLYVGCVVSQVGHLVGLVMDVVVVDHPPLLLLQMPCMHVLPLLQSVDGQLVCVI
jgi:hypothetical protein